jgi:hypothetical protein
MEDLPIQELISQVVIEERNAAVLPGAFEPEKEGPLLIS